jgi:hypothetical protein
MDVSTFPSASPIGMATLTIVTLSDSRCHDMSIGGSIGFGRRLFGPSLYAWRLISIENTLGRYASDRKGMYHMSRGWISDLTKHTDASLL